MAVERAPIRVMLVDDHDLVRTGVRTLVNVQPDMEAVGEATSASEALQVAERLRPDVVLMDVRLGDGSGIDVTRELLGRLPNTKVLMLTGMEDDETLFAAIQAGAAGYMLKAVPNAELVRAIRTVADGGSTLDTVVIGPVLAELRRQRASQQDERLARLSAQEQRVLVLLTRGRTNRDIAADMHLAEKTIKNYVSSVLSKLEVGGRAEAAAYFSRHTTTPGA
jgi:DNA-binding NarL/FixJ family response regulator